MRTALVLFLVAFNCVAFAGNSFAFLQGMNLALGVDKNQDINQCIFRLFMVTNVHDEETAQVCVQAFDTYLTTLNYLADTNMEAESPEQTAMTLINSTVGVFKNLGKNYNFEAGQNAGGLLKDLFLSSKLIGERRLFSDAVSPYNIAEILLGINDQLAIANDQSLTTCASDAKQIESVVQGLLLALKEKNLVESIHDVLTLVSILPGVKGPCGDALQGAAAFIKPIEQTYKKDPQAFAQTIQNNLEKNPFGIALALIKITQDLKEGKDYNAGTDIGAFIQMALKGIL